MLAVVPAVIVLIHGQLAYLHRLMRRSQGQAKPATPPRAHSRSNSARSAGFVPLAAIDATQHRFTDKHDLAIVIDLGLLVLRASHLIDFLRPFPMNAATPHQSSLDW
jgi:hypothetical protein